VYELSIAGGLSPRQWNWQSAKTVLTVSIPEIFNDFKTEIRSSTGACG
jgi:hypothetical protein